jgi:tRNA G18 (ribose-2'-O)-methylase SpoU
MLPPTQPDPERPAVDPGSGPTEWVFGEPIGVGPWPGPWPTDPRFDPELLRAGDSRNVVDHYRYWSRPAVVADLDTRRHEFQVAIENLRHDHNIGTVVRTANAFAASAVHIVGRKRWNRRGAMVTDRYQHIHHHLDIPALEAYVHAERYSIVAVDNTPGSIRLERTVLPRRCVLLFGQEGSGLSEQARAAATLLVSIAQFGSTRSINAGVAAGIVMHSWITNHADLDTAW